MKRNHKRIRVVLIEQVATYPAVKAQNAARSVTPKELVVRYAKLMTGIACQNQTEITRILRVAINLLVKMTP